MHYWLPNLIAKIPASVYSKLQTAFLIIVALLMLFGGIVLGAMSSMNNQSEDLINLHQKTAAFRQLQQDITYQLYSVTAALVSRDERQLSIIARQLHQSRYNLDRVQFVSTDELNLFERVSKDQENLANLITDIVEGIKSHSSPDLIERIFTEATLLAENLELLTNEMVNRAESDMLAKIDQTNEAYRTSKILVIGFSVGCVILALILGYAVSISLLKPIKLIDDSLNQTAAGDFTQQVEVPNRDELGSLSEHLNQMNSELDRLYQKLETANQQMEEKNVQLAKTLRQVELYSEMLSNELEKGRKMQKSFLPAQLPELSGWEMRTFFQPAKQVAGDFYDVFELPRNHLGIVVADVCDKGVGAALFMALFRSLIRIYAGGNESERSHLLEGAPHPNKVAHPGELSGITNSPHLGPLNAVSATNNYIANNHGDVSMFATMFFGILNATSGLLSYINGGHEPIIISGPQGGAKNTLDPTGPAVGMLPDIDFKVGQTIIEAGDTLFAFTDGVSEAQSVDNELFTKDRLLSQFLEPFSSIDELMRRIEGQLLGHIGNIEQSDDITFMSIRRLN